jgi:membrane associated rhomboid family serine protease
MQIRIPDPAYTGSEQRRADFGAAATLALGFVLLLWFVQVVNAALDLELQRFGVAPRELSGLAGILVAPLLHGGFGHLIANSIPLLVVGTAMLYLYPDASSKVLPAVYFGPGIAVWIFARGGIHVGASGLIYGLAAYVFAAGVIRRDRRAIAASLLVAFIYGSLAWGVLPLREEVSWETHLAAALLGFALAIVFRRLDVPPPKRYAWESEAEADVDAAPGDDHVA